RTGAPGGAARRRRLRAVGAPPLTAARLCSESGPHETGRDGDGRDDARRPLGRRFRLGLGVSGPQVVASFWANGASGVTMLTVAGDRPAAHTTAELGS